MMADFRFGNFGSTFEFFILSRLSDGPKSFSEIQQRLRYAERFLYVAARNKGQQSYGSLLALLQKLHREGFLSVMPGGPEQPAGDVYVLTEAGVQRPAQEQARYRSLVSQFVEETDLNRSFRKFLDGHLPQFS